MVQLMSPVIGEDSALFDRLTLRMRFIHHSPIEGHLWMHWSNVKYSRRTDFNVNEARFREQRRQLYPIEWEEITVDLRALAEAGPAVRDYPATWEDTLFNFHLTMWGSGDVDDYPTLPGNRQYPAHRSRGVGAGGIGRPGISRWRWGRPARCSPGSTSTPSEAPSGVGRAVRWGTSTTMAMRISQWPGIATWTAKRTDRLAHGVQRRAGPL